MSRWSFGILRLLSFRRLWWCKDNGEKFKKN